jgi:chloramphenicol-sensitive protein RarD
MPPLSSVRIGTLLGLSAYIIWGSFPAYFKAVASVPVPEILAHRIIWSVVFLLVFVFVTGRGRQLAETLKDRRARGVLLVTALLLSVNWFTFIGAVAAGKVLESSLGYYINPLVSVFLGFLFLKERLTRRQWASIALAGTGVVVQTVMVGRLPAISLVLAFSFGLYGLVRKAAGVKPVTGLTVEMLLICPVALAYMGTLMAGGRARFLSGNTHIDVLLLLAGVITATPLILYGRALRRLRLSTMGIMQYIVPTSHFLWAVLAFGESFTMAHLVSFGFIWTALALYTSEAFEKIKPTTVGAGVGRQ